MDRDGFACSGSRVVAVKRSEFRSLSLMLIKIRWSDDRDFPAVDVEIFIMCNKWNAFNAGDTGIE